MDSFKQTASEVLNELGVNPDKGLNDEEVKTSREKNGTNSFGEGEKSTLPIASAGLKIALLFPVPDVVPLCVP